MTASRSKLFSVFDFFDKEIISHKFDYISDDVKKTNLVNSFIYTLFLVSLEKAYELEEPISFLIFKDIIIHSASILECLLNYLALDIYETKVISMEELGYTDIEYEFVKELYKNEEVDLVLSNRIKKSKVLKKDSNFNEINRYLLKINVLNKDLYDKSEKIRILRNKIHLSSLSEKDQSKHYNKECVESIFSDLAEVIKLVEKFLR